MLAPLFAAIAPFVIWPIERFLPYPYLIEELGKFLIVLIILREIKDKRNAILLAILSGFLFAISETVFYLFNIYAGSGISLLLQRFLFTIPLHTITFLLIILPALKNRRYILIGLILAILLHYLYNITIQKVIF